MKWCSTLTPPLTNQLPTQPWTLNHDVLRFCPMWFVTYAPLGRRVFKAWACLRLGLANSNKRPFCTANSCTSFRQCAQADKLEHWGSIAIFFFVLKWIHNCNYYPNVKYDIYFHSFISVLKYMPIEYLSSSSSSYSFSSLVFHSLSSVNIVKFGPQG